VKKSLKGTQSLVTGCALQNPFSSRECGRYTPATYLAGSQKQQSSSQPTIKKHNVPGGIDE
jgi:hypothetical protein